MTEKERILLLRQQLNEHNRRYYVENNPIISDQEYDLMMHELQDLEARHPEMYDALSPTLRVGSDLKAPRQLSLFGDENTPAEPIDGFRKVVHRYPMLTLANT